MAADYQAAIFFIIFFENIQKLKTLINTILK